MLCNAATAEEMSGCDIMAQPNEGETSAENGVLVSHLKIFGESTNITGD